MTLNPFASTKPKKSLQYYIFWLISYILAPIVTPIRIFLLLIIVSLSHVIMSRLIKSVNLQKPLSPLRTTITRFLTINLTRGFLWSMGVKIVQKNIQKRPTYSSDFALVSNHNSSLDPLVLQVVGACSFVSKSEVGRSPVFGLFAKANQCIFIDRSDKNSGKTVQEKLIQRVAGDVQLAGYPRKFQMITVFPEGTCNSGTAVLPFKTGVFNAKKPVQLCIIRWDKRYSCLSDSGQSMTKVLFNLILGIRQIVEINWLGEYIPGVDEIEDSAIYAENVREIFVVQMGVPKTAFGIKERYWYLGKKKDYQECSSEWQSAFPESSQLKK
ncbi:Lysophospholipid acyltransferase [Spironucleus salmonicida]|uniref:Acyltransferase domain protein n=1 Tax=Spironucleus salmonicida TaxID=348837 RepID=S5UK97_9EUKA|nr:acyltransferase domain protein [Spironucleus salmonicida]KAH0575524.1 Lysophospholipid acyltransferase [Spironucleus salmonicida]|eukprot:EST41667.1 Acyltransferase domain-containing protein [Spironucleus salmonicida]